MEQWENPPALQESRRNSEISEPLKAERFTPLFRMIRILVTVEISE